MASVQSTNSAADIFATLNGNGATTGANATSTTQEAQDRFLKLLVTQLKNQDPLNPLDNAQVTTQLAQINTVTGIEKLNTTLGTLLSSLNDSQAMEAAGLIGKSVLVPGSGLALTNGEAYGGINLSAPADHVTLKIFDATGKLLKTQDLGAHDAGNFNFGWNGSTDAGTTAATGNYKFSVEAIRDGEKVAADGLQIGTVSALVRAKSGFLLDLGSLGTVDFKNVQQVL